MAFTGPDINTYTIPEVQLGDTFNFWREITNTNTYKLNKLRIYDAADTASIGVTYGTDGVLTNSILSSVTTGHTFASLVMFTSGLTASGIYASSGSTFGGGVWIGGGVTVGSLYASSGSTFGARVWMAGGVTVGSLYASSGSTFGGGVWIRGGLSGLSAGLSASAVYASTGSTFAGNLRVGSDSVGATLGVCGGIMLHSASPLRFGVTTSNRWVAFQAPNSVAANLTWTLPSVDGGAGQVLCTNGGVLGWTTPVLSGATGSSTQLQYKSNSGFSASSALTLTAGGLSASAVYASTGSTFAGNLRIGSDSVGATLGVCGGIMLHSASPLRFGAATSGRWVAFQAPNSVAANLTWTLPSVIGSNTYLLCTTAGVLGWISPTISGVPRPFQAAQGSTPILYNGGNACNFDGDNNWKVGVCAAADAFSIGSESSTEWGLTSVRCNNVLIGGQSRVGTMTATCTTSPDSCDNVLMTTRGRDSAQLTSSKGNVYVWTGVFAATVLQGQGNPGLSGSNNVYIGSASSGSDGSDTPIPAETSWSHNTVLFLEHKMPSSQACFNTYLKTSVYESRDAGPGVAGSFTDSKCGLYNTIIRGCICDTYQNENRVMSTRNKNVFLCSGFRTTAPIILECNTMVGFGGLTSGVTFGTVSCNTSISRRNCICQADLCNATAIGSLTDFYASNTVKLGNTASNVALTGSIINNSDCRNKTDVRPTIWGLDFINALRPVDYRWDHRSDYADGTPDGSKKGTRFHSGLLAQEVQAAASAAGEDFAGVIHWSYNGISQGPEEFGLKYDYFYAPLIRAVQELSVRTEQLEAQWR